MSIQHTQEENRNGMERLWETQKYHEQSENMAWEQVLKHTTVLCKWCVPLLWGNLVDISGHGNSTPVSSSQRRHMSQLVDKSGLIFFFLGVRLRSGYQNMKLCHGYRKSSIAEEKLLSALMASIWVKSCMKINFWNTQNTPLLIFKHHILYNKQALHISLLDKYQ